MKEGWEYREFERCLKKVPKQKAVKSKDYLEEGKCPIISQESYLISGYTNDEALLYKHERPVVIFGDHTKNVKYVPFNFVVGADGVHILSPQDDILPKFFYYELCSIKLRDLGYARHYKLLKEKLLGIPSYPEQERIVALLDKQFEYIDILKNNAEHQLQDAKDFFQAALKEVFEANRNWKYKSFEDCLQKVPKQKAVKSKDYLENGMFPIVSQESDLISGYTDDENILYKHENPVIIFGDHTKNIKYIDFNFVVGADGVHILSVKDDILPKFFYYELCSIKLRNLGYARHYKLLKEKEIGYPNLTEQERIAARLDAISEKVKALQANYDNTITLCNDLKQSLLKSIFE